MMPDSDPFGLNARDHYFNRLTEDYLSALADAKRLAKQGGQRLGFQITVPVLAQPLRVAVQAFVDGLLSYAGEEAEFRLSMAMAQTTEAMANPYAEDREREAVRRATVLQPKLGSRSRTGSSEEAQDYLLAEAWNREISRIRRTYEIERARIAAAMGTLNPPVLGAKGKRHGRSRNASRAYGFYRTRP